MTRHVLTKSLMATSMLAGTAAVANAADLGVVDVVTPAEPVVDHHRISGVFDVSFGYLFSRDSNYDGHLVSGGAKANLWLSPMASLQLDAWGELDDVFDGYSTFGIAGHLAWRDPNSFAIAAFGSYGDAGNTLFSNWGTIGVEGQAYFGNLTLYAQAAYMSAMDFPGSAYDGFYAFGEARYFFTPNIMVAGHLAYDNVLPGGDLGDTFRWGLGIEAKHDNTGIVGFASYQGATPLTGSHFPDEHAFLGGIKILMGQDTLLANDRYGATFVDHNPIYGRTRLRGLVIDAP